MHFGLLGIDEDVAIHFLVVEQDGGTILQQIDEALTSKRTHMLRQRRKAIQRLF